MGLRLGIIAAFIIGMACFAHPASAETRALIAGVSTYPSLPETLHLKGPRNDARQVANALVGFGVSPDNVTVLADGVVGLSDGIAPAREATREAILGELDRLARTSAPGDLVVFYFSGHGSQQPDLDGDELGGTDEIFLPYDVGAWTGEKVENAIVDDDLRVRIDAILAAGADFFGIIDACHSATGFRAIGDDDVRSRQVDPSALGIPEERAASFSQSTTPLMTGSEAPGRGRAAFFYAAQETEVALEKRPKDAESDEVYGVFTFNILRRLAQNPNVTYRTLHDAVVSDIKRGTLMATQTPELEGDLLDEPALRLTDAAPVRQWPVRAGKLQAGQLEGLTAGALIALYDEAVATDPIGEAVIEAAGASQSSVAPTASTSPEAMKKARFARLLEPGIDLTVVLSTPLRADPGDGLDYAPALAAFDAAIASPRLAQRVDVAASGYDVAVALVDGTLAFAPASGLIDAAGRGSSPRVTLGGSGDIAVASVVAAIERVARATALHRLAELSDPNGDVGLASEMMIAEPVALPAEGEPCLDYDGTNYDQPVRATGPPMLSTCDVIILALKNGGRKPLDATVMLIGADFSITPLWPDAGAVNRIHPDLSVTLPLLRIEPDEGSGARGEERLVVVAVPGSGRSHTSFENFAQEGVRAVDDDADEALLATRDLIATGINDMGQARTSVPTAVSEEISIAILPFHSSAGGRE
jgi:hypothetical protein